MYHWSFRRCSARWELILTDSRDFEKVLYAPGYVSAKSGDIIKAMLYLNTGIRGALSGQTVGLLERIREDTYSALGKEDRRERKEYT